METFMICICCVAIGYTLGYVEKLDSMKEE